MFRNTHNLGETPEQVIYIYLLSQSHKAFGSAVEGTIESKHLNWNSPDSHACPTLCYEGRWYHPWRGILGSSQKHLEYDFARQVVVRGAMSRKPNCDKDIIFKPD